MRIAMGIEYDGSDYNGWQAQRHGTGIQQVFEAALSKVADQEVKVICAGRTDTGVHALGQVIHFDTTAKRNGRSWILGSNANLPKNISVTWAAEVPDEFHARYSAVSRAYRYIILNREVRPAVLTNKVCWDYRPLDVNKMQDAAVHLLGEHDFTSYRTVHCQSKTPMRNIIRLDVGRDGNLVFIDIEANAFLHHMVRNIAGVLMTIGAGEQDSDWSRVVLEERDRTRASVTAPATGLYFKMVRYPEKYNLPSVAASFGYLSLLTTD